MKYLKPHPINESVDSDIKHDIEDILLDLNDKGIWTEVIPVESYHPTTFDEVKKFEITMQRDIEDSDYYEDFYEQVKWNEIEEVVDRLIDFLKSKRYDKLSIMVDGSVDREDINWVEDMKTKGDYEFDSLTFWFSKINQPF